VVSRWKVSDIISRVIYARLTSQCDVERIFALALVVYGVLYSAVARPATTVSN